MSRSFKQSRRSAYRKTFTAALPAPRTQAPPPRPELPPHGFTQDQIDSLIFRLRQSRDELLYDAREQCRLNYAYHQRDGRILGVAHCDYVETAWSYPTFTDTDQQIIRAGQVDDRVGVWLLLDILHTLPEFPAYDILLTDNEETGQSTAEDFDDDIDAWRMKTQLYNWTFQFDRRGTDFVDYDRANPQFISDFIRLTGIPHGLGTFSDICKLSDTFGSRVNIGTGYHNEHSPNAHVDLRETWDQVQRFARFARDRAGQAYHARPEQRWTGFSQFDRLPTPSHGPTRHATGWSLPDTEISIESQYEIDLEAIADDAQEIGTTDPDDPWEQRDIWNY